MLEVEINTEFIKLDQLLKWAGVCISGAEAKELIQLNKVKVNNEIENRRGKKIRTGDIVEVLDKSIKVL